MKRTPAGFNPDEGSILNQLVRNLTERSNQSLWSRVERLLAAGVPEVPHSDRTRPVRRPKSQRHHRLPAGTMDEVVADYKAGMSARACGKKHGIDTHTVLNHLQRRGITARPATEPRMVGETLERARELRAQGWSYQAIGVEFGVSHTAARNAILNVQTQKST